MAVLCNRRPYWFEVSAFFLIVLFVTAIIAGPMLVNESGKAVWLEIKDCQETCCPLFCSNSTDAPGCELSCLDECDSKGRREIVCRDRPESQNE